jgi:hypothetical protein
MRRKRTSRDSQATQNNQPHENAPQESKRLKNSIRRSGGNFMMRETNGCLKVETGFRQGVPRR